MTTFVLVPGFWLGGWAWDEVTPRLRAEGHQVLPLTLTGLAERAGEASAKVDLETHISDIVRTLEEDDLRDVVLVAHSGATSPVTGAADRIPDRVARLVYVDTGPLPGGMAQIDFHEPEVQEAMRAQVDADTDGWRLPVPAFDPAADPVNLAGLSEGQLALMRERGTPQPFGTVIQPLRRPAEPPPHPKTLVLCTFTTETVTALAASGNPVFGLMGGAEWSHHELPTGHWPMFSRPDDLAALLDREA